MVLYSVHCNGPIHRENNRCTPVVALLHGTYSYTIDVHEKDGVLWRASKLLPVNTTHLTMLPCKACERCLSLVVLEAPTFTLYNLVLAQHIALYDHMTGLGSCFPTVQDSSLQQNLTIFHLEIYNYS